MTRSRNSIGSAVSFLQSRTLVQISGGQWLIPPEHSDVVFMGPNERPGLRAKPVHIGATRGGQVLPSEGSVGGSNISSCLAMSRHWAARSR
jgi:hypothetical protein